MIHKNIFEDPMQMEEYLEERLLEIKDIEERGSLREILTNTFLPMYQHMEEKYQELGHRLEQEKLNAQGDFTIACSIIARQRYDATLEAMYPMRMEDLEEEEVDNDAILKAIEEKEEFYFYSVFLAADYLVLKDLEARKRIFTGTIKTTYGEYQGTFRLKKDETYIAMLSELYDVFLRNGVSWSTVCTPYLHKIYGLYLVEAESILEEEILGIHVDFEDLSEVVMYKAVPIWNIHQVSEKTSSYPEACVDKIQYQHVIYRHRLKEGREYLIMDSDVDLYQVRRIEDDLYITCDESQPRKWNLLEFGHTPFDKGAYPVMENRMRIDLFVGQRMQVKRMRTLGEINRFLLSLGYQEEIELKEVTLSGSKEETYSMDPLLADEIGIGDSPYTLQFQFRGKGEASFYTRDIMSYLVTRLQNEYPEYRCVGCLIG